MRPGVVDVDNPLWGGREACPLNEGDAETPVIQALNEQIHADLRVDASMLALIDRVYLARSSCAASAEARGGG